MELIETKVLLAKSGCKYIRIVLDAKIIIIFETQTWLIDEIYRLLNVSHFENYDLDVLATYLNQDNIYIINDVMNRKNQLFDSWEENCYYNEFDDEYNNSEV